MTRYQPLDKPLHVYTQFKKEGVSPLHLLYPGRYMVVPRGFGYDERDSYYENEQPELAGRTFERRRESCLEYAKELNNTALKQSGNKRISRHPHIEPDAVVEDPEMKYVDFNSPVNVSNFKVNK